MVEFGYLGKGKAPNSIHTQDASLAPNGINQKIGFVSTEGYPHLKLPLPFMCLTGNRKGAKLRAVSCNLISLASKALKTKKFIIPVKNGGYLHFSQPRLH